MCGSANLIHIIFIYRIKIHFCTQFKKKKRKRRKEKRQAANVIGFLSETVDTFVDV